MDYRSRHLEKVTLKHALLPSQAGSSGVRRSGSHPGSPTEALERNPGPMKLLHSFDPQIYDFICVDKQSCLAVVQI